MVRDRETPRGRAPNAYDQAWKGIDSPRVPPRRPRGEPHREKAGSLAPNKRVEFPRRPHANATHTSLASTAAPRPAGSSHNVSASALRAERMNKACGSRPIRSRRRVHLPDALEVRIHGALHPNGGDRERRNPGRARIRPTAIHTHQGRHRGTWSGDTPETPGDAHQGAIAYPARPRSKGETMK